MSGAIALGAMAGGIAGWMLVPKTADILLRRAHRRAAAWWWGCLEAYREFARAHPGRVPALSAPGEEGALALWRDDAVRSAKEGSLSRERALALAGVGIDAEADAEGDARLLDEEERRRRCTFAPHCWQRAACAAGGAGACAGLGMLVACGGASMPEACTLLLCAFAMGVAVVCDLRARTLPLETCALLAVAGALFQLFAQGVAGVAAGAACAVVVVGGCLVANRVAGRRGKTAVGYGDVRCMAALSLACGATAPLGFAACYACAGAFSLGGLALRRLVPSDGIPMAPFLALWLACGAAANVMA